MLHGGLVITKVLNYNTVPSTTVQGSVLSSNGNRMYSMTNFLTHEDTVCICHWDLTPYILFAFM